jgi:glycosyltransferase involved in cell wall biosynthesis
MSYSLVSIITVTYNSKSTISDTIRSVLEQTYPGIEYIIIDGLSTDGTQDIVRSFGTKISKFVSEKDIGIYDAINKGIRLSTGEIIGILNSDDSFYTDQVIERVVSAFNEDDIHAVYGDIQFFDREDPSKIVRYYSSKRFNPGMFKFGIMPAHPSFYAKRELFEKFGYYKTDYKIAADFELLIRFLNIHKIRTKYIQMPFVSMRPGGISNKSVISNITLNKEIARACRENGIKTNYLYIYSKYFFKIFEFFGRKTYKTN